MQPRTGKHRPLPAENRGLSNSPDQLPNAPLGLGSPPERNNGGLPPAAAPPPLQDVSPNVPFLSLSQYPSPATKLLGSPNVARRLSFSIGATAAFSVPEFANASNNNSNSFEQQQHHGIGLASLLSHMAPPPGCPWVEEFGELADLSKLGSLPSEDEFLLKFVDHSKEETTVGGEPSNMMNLIHHHPQQQQDFNYAHQPRSYFRFPLQVPSQQTQQQTQHQQQDGHLWVPTQQQQQQQHQSFDPGFSSEAPTPVTKLSKQQHYQMHSGVHPSVTSASFYLGNVSSGPPPPAVAAAAVYTTPTNYSTRPNKRRAPESEVAAVPPSSVASRGYNTKQQRQNGNYSGLYNTQHPQFTPQYHHHHQQQQQRSTKNNNNNRNAHQLSALPDDFESDDPGANTGKTYRGVSRHRLTQRWEASLWLNGRQLYLGGFDAQIDAAKAYDLAALACKGPDAIINMPAEEYDDQLKEIAGFSREEVVAYVRRRSAAFSRGKSKYRGVSGHNGRWEARIGSFNGRKNVSFGVFETEECAGRQYDRALILEKGRSAKTNFPLRDYEAEVEVYKAHMARVCGQLPRGSQAVVREVEAYTLPRNREATPDEKKRSAIIYGESLRQALEGH